MDYKKLGYMKMRIAQLRRWKVTQKVNEDNLLYFGQLPVIEYITNHPGCKQKEIAENFAVSRATITKSIRRMINAGVITRNVNDEDERKFQLFVTDLGIQASDKFREVFNNVDEEMFKNFSQEEKEMYYQMTERMMQNLETNYSRDKTLGQLIQDNIRCERNDEDEENN